MTNPNEIQDEALSQALAYYRGVAPVAHQLFHARSAVYAAYPALAAEYNEATDAYQHSAEARALTAILADRIDTLARKVLDLAEAR